jgi:hypothetical protein
MKLIEQVKALAEAEIREDEQLVSAKISSMTNEELRVLAAAFYDFWQATLHNTPSQFVELCDFITEEE